MFAVLGGPNEDGQAPAGKYGPSTVLRSTYEGRQVKVIADLGKYELAHNPDGQVQFVDGKPVDALSNPFAMTMSRYGLIVADGGANDVLRVDPSSGRVSTFFVPHTVTDVKACLAPGAQSNPGTVGCDPVPTGVAVSRGSVYVSTLGAEQPGAGRVYKLDERTGKVQRVWRGLTSPTGIAVRDDGTVYVSEVLFGAPAGDGPPPPGFDPSQGRPDHEDQPRQDHARAGDDADRPGSSPMARCTPPPGASPASSACSTRVRSSRSPRARSTEPDGERCPDPHRSGHRVVRGSPSRGFRIRRRGTT